MDSYDEETLMAQFYNVITGDLIEAQAFLPIRPDEWVVLTPDGKRRPMPVTGFVDLAPTPVVSSQPYRRSPTDKWDGVGWVPGR